MFKTTRLILFITIFWSTFSYAEIAAPLGIEPGKSTLKDIESKHKIISKHCETKEQTSCAYSIDPTKLPLTNVSELLFYCNSQEIVKAVFVEANKSNFENLFESLSKKYKLEEKHIPFVGNKSAVFQADNNVVVTLNAPHMSFKMTLLYITRENYNNLIEYRKKEQQNKKQNLDDSL